jgi:catechol 2,3-dioxygenase-like lactoylglutathione lyase family enzyme
MPLDLRRVILFVDDLNAMTDFYEKKLGLRVSNREEGFVDFDAGGTKLALHAGVSNPGRTKICFFAADVSKARQELIDRGVRMGKDPGPGEGIKLCDGKDPEGNTFQLSNRP